MAEQPFKLVITGAFNTGKTTFVRSLSEIDVVDTDRATSTASEQRVKSTTTVAMDYGRIHIDKRVIQLFGTPGQTRFEFMRDILAKDMDGFLVLVDTTDAATVDAAANLVERFKDYASVPFAIVANKSDLSAESNYATLRQQLDLPENIQIYPCTATDRESVRNVVRQFLDAATK